MSHGSGIVSHNEGNYEPAPATAMRREAKFAAASVTPMGGSVYSVVEINHGKRGNRRPADTEVVGKGPLERKPLTLRIEPLYPYAANPIALRCYPSTLTLLTLYPYAANPLPISELHGGFAVPSWGIKRPFVGDRASLRGQCKSSFCKFVPVHSSLTAGM